MNNKKHQPFCLAMLLVVSGTCLLAAPVIADVNRGEALYENHCQECHDTIVHKRQDRKVESIETLRAWVMSMSVHTGLTWAEAEVSDITQYLNQRFYRINE